MLTKKQRSALNYVAARMAVDPLCSIYYLAVEYGLSLDEADDLSYQVIRPFIYESGTGTVADYDFELMVLFTLEMDLGN